MKEHTMRMRANMSRREFGLGASGAAMALLTVGNAWPSIASAQDAHERLLLSAPLTHSDWMFRAGATWGPEGLHHMLDTCKATGWTRIHWRVFDGGRALYRSKLMDPEGKQEDDSYARHIGDFETLKKYESLDYAHFDALAEAVRYGHQIGLEVYAWASINEDDHAWGCRSRFAIAHPECRWRKRNGAFYHSQMSFAFPEVMQYKLALIGELLDGYQIDGLFFDWIRTGDIRDNPQTDAEGVADHGYEQPLLDGFKARLGIDPLSIPNGDDRWVRFRAQPHTEFMRGVRKLIAAKRPALPVTVLVAHPWMYRGDKNKIDGSLRGLLLDLPTWAKEGLIDAAAPAGYYLPGGDAEQAYQALREETLGKTPIVLYRQVPGSAQQLQDGLQSARRVGARQILFWEADYIDGLDQHAKTEVQRVMRLHGAAPGLHDNDSR